jgi:hypothetical protein
MSLYIFSPLLVLIIDTACVFCEVYTENEETNLSRRKCVFCVVRAEAEGIFQNRA